MSSVHPQRLKHIDYKTKALVFGYIHEIERAILDDRIVPVGIIHLCLLFHAISFEWDPSKKPKEIVLSDNNRTVRSDFGRWTSVISKCLLSADKVSKVEWEITIRARPKYLYFMMGYAESESKVLYKSNIAHKAGCCALYLYSESTFRNYKAGTSTDYMDKWNAKNYGVGDRFELRFNFPDKNCNVYCNGERVGFLTENLPENIYPAMSFSGKHVFETTKWNVQ